MHFRYANHPSSPYDTRKSGFNESTNRIKKRAVPWPLAIHHDTLQQSIQNDVPTILEAAFTDDRIGSVITILGTQTLNGAGILT